MYDGSMTDMCCFFKDDCDTRKHMYRAVFLYIGPVVYLDASPVTT